MNSEARKSIHGTWTGRWTFILAAAGSAVGLGNIWKFPYMAGEYGGGAFVLVYLACILLIGIPIMIAEILIGRRGRSSPANSMSYLAKEANTYPQWKILGIMGAVAGLAILSFYCEGLSTFRVNYFSKYIKLICKLGSFIRILRKGEEYDK